MIAQEKANVDAQHASADILAKRFAGQTIRTASLDVKKNGGVLHLDLVGTKSPAKLEWKANGKVVFTFKERSYILHK